MSVTTLSRADTFVKGRTITNSVIPWFRSIRIMINSSVRPKKLSTDGSSKRGLVPYWKVWSNCSPKYSEILYWVAFNCNFTVNNRKKCDGLHNVPGGCTSVKCQYGITWQVLAATGSWLSQWLAGDQVAGWAAGGSSGRLSVLSGLTWLRSCDFDSLSASFAACFWYSYWFLADARITRRQKTNCS